MRKPTLKELKSEKDDIAKIEAWLTRIGEYDESCRKEVIDQCKSDLNARAYYVKQSEG